MGLIVRAFTRRNLIAIAAGVLLAGAPLVAFDFWLDRLIDRQGQTEVETSAKRAIALAESRVTQVVGALDDLAARGTDSCRPTHVDAMRYAAFNTSPIKEVAIVGPDGQTHVHPSRPAARPAQGDFLGAAGRRRRLFPRHHPARERPADGAAAPQGRRRAQWSCGAGARLPVPAAGVHPRRSVQRLRAHRHPRRRLDRRNRRAAGRRRRRHVRGEDEIRQIRLRRRNIDVARTGDRRPCRSEMARHIRHRRRGVDPVRFRRADAAPRDRQSGGRYRARARRRRIRALLPADRRYPLRPIARRRGAGALAQSRTARWCCPAPSFRWRNRAG